MRLRTKIPTPLNRLLAVATEGWASANPPQIMQALSTVDNRGREPLLSSMWLVFPSPEEGHHLTCEGFSLCCTGKMGLSSRRSLFFILSASMSNKAGTSRGVQHGGTRTLINE